MDSGVSIGDDGEEYFDDLKLHKVVSFRSALADGLNNSVD